MNVVSAKKIRWDLEWRKLDNYKNTKLPVNDEVSLKSGQNYKITRLARLKELNY